MRLIAKESNKRITGVRKRLLKLIMKIEEGLKRDHNQSKLSQKQVMFNFSPL